jgi:hypothetical protein
MRPPLPALAAEPPLPAAPERPAVSPVVPAPALVPAFPLPAPLPPRAPCPLALAAAPLVPALEFEAPDAPAIAADLPAPPVPPGMAPFVVPIQGRSSFEAQLVVAANRPNDSAAANRVEGSMNRVMQGSWVEPGKNFYRFGSNAVGGTKAETSL